MRHRFLTRPLSAVLLPLTLALTLVGTLFAAATSGSPPGPTASATADPAGRSVEPAATRHPDPGDRPTIVLVHGAFADASSWSEVTQRLQRKGYTVYAPANPLRGIDARRRLPARVPGDRPRTGRARRPLLRRRRHHQRRHRATATSRPSSTSRRTRSTRARASAPPTRWAAAPPCSASTSWSGRPRAPHPVTWTPTSTRRSSGTSSRRTCPRRRPR